MERDEARTALHSIEAARRRRGTVARSPGWLYSGVATCLAADGFASLLTGTPRLIAQLVLLAAIFAVAFAAQRHSGVVARLIRPPARPWWSWVAFTAIVLGGLAVSRLATRVVGDCALAALIVVLGPRLSTWWARAR